MVMVIGGGQGPDLSLQSGCQSAFELVRSPYRVGHPQAALSNRRTLSNVDEGNQNGSSATRVEKQLAAGFDVI